jgi:uncharacterized protein YcfL
MKNIVIALAGLSLVACSAPTEATTEVPEEVVVEEVTAEVPAEVVEGEFVEEVAEEIVAEEPK